MQIVSEFQRNSNPLQVVQNPATGAARALASGELLAAALAYAAMDWHVLPLHEPKPANGSPCSCGSHDCNSPGKHPRVKFADATTDEARVRYFWNQWPTAGIGLIAPAG